MTILLLLTILASASLSTLAALCIVAGLGWQERRRPCECCFYDPIYFDIKVTWNGVEYNAMINNMIGALNSCTWPQAVPHGSTITFVDPPNVPH